MKSSWRWFVLLALLFCSPHPVYAACASPAGVEGQIMYNSTSHVMQYCNNLNVWHAMDTAARAGGAGCANPSGTQGDITYNKTYHMLQYCDGVTWRAATGATNYNSGLVGWWKMDETSGTTAADSQASNNGTLVNGPTWTAGKVNGALAFNGTTQPGVHVNPPASLNNLSAVSASVWVNPTNFSADIGIIDKGNAGIGWVLTLHIDGTLTFDGIFPTNNASRTTSTTIPTGTWTHVAATWDGSVTGSNVHIYINGAEASYSSTVNATGIRADDSAAALDLGTCCAASINLALDDVRIWNRALSTPEIASLFRDTNGGACGPTGLVGWWKLDDGLSGSPPTTGLVGWWKLDDGGGTFAADSSGTGNGGWTQNGPTWVTGHIGGALTFNGTTQYVNIADVSSLQLSGSWTVAAWANVTALPANGTKAKVLNKSGNGGAGDNYGIGIENNTTDCPGSAVWRVAFDDELTPGSGQICGTAVTLGTWHHVVGVWDSAASNLSLYENGALVATTNFAGLRPAFGPGTLLALGSNSSLTQYFFNGTIDDARVYNRALSAAEVAAVYNNGANSPTAADSSGNGNTGTLVGGPTWTTSGKINGALNLDSASSQYVDVPDVASLRMSTSFTIAGWVNLSVLPSGGNWKNLLTKGGGSSSTNYEIDVDSGHFGAGLGLVFNYNSTGCCDDRYAKYVTAITTGTWYHVAGVYDSAAHTQYLYLNGSLVATHDVAGLPPEYGAGDDLHMGTGSSAYMTGTIDDVRIYSRALTAADVLNLYNGTDSGVEGQIMYNANSHIPQFCDGTRWHATQ